MTLNKNIIQKKRIYLPFLIILVFIILSTLPFAYNQWIENVFIDLQFQIRGSRNLSDKIVFVFIGPEDVQDLGGWPISRDYYGYTTYILKRAGARVIGFDMLFEKPDPVYPEFDKMMTDFMVSAGNVCLPMAFGEMKYDKSKNNDSNYFTGFQPVYPMEQISAVSAGTGFSNFGNQPDILSVPLVAKSNDRLFYSFGAELARRYLSPDSELSVLNNNLVIKTGIDKSIRIPLDKSGQIKLNHFGGVRNLNSISLVDLLQAYERSPDSLDFSDKLVLVGVTAPSISIIKETPLSNSLPASLIHATVAENIIEGNFLRDPPFFLQWIIIATLVFLVYALWQLKFMSNRNWIGFALLAVFLLATITAFRQIHLIIPIFYPALALVFTDFTLKILKRQDLQSEGLSVRNLLEDHLKQKEKELAQARTTLLKYQEELKQKEKHSEELEQVARTRQEAILQLENELHDLESYIIPEKPSTVPEFADMIHASNSKLKEVLELIHRIRSDDIPVLIIGETGTGKEMIARAIHQTSPRKDKPFIAVNCGALTETLLESELFGHEKGSFTGAHSRRRGRFELADSGTIFLDEITETSPSFQSKLLRILQEGIFERVGGEQSIKVDVRVIAASNKDLKSFIEAGKFRDDLFYRLNGFPMNLPPLRERLEDIPLIANHFLGKHHYPPVKKFSDQAMSVLVQYCWPGNVRELENIVRRAALLAQSEKREMIRLTDLPAEIQSGISPEKVGEKFHSFEDQILEMLRSFQFSHSAISKTAKALGNKDRGTITEYFRGICFRELVEANFDSLKAAEKISGSQDIKIVERVMKKIREYIKNLMPFPDQQSLTGDEYGRLPQFKGLPRKYHQDLIRLISYLQK
jgi:transcriptional regulator with GAF, ATPase, and Fis domain/CHASE2 domain-containing sensor protein